MSRQGERALANAMRDYRRYLAADRADPGAVDRWITASRDELTAAGYRDDELILRLVAEMPMSMSVKVSMRLIGDRVS